MIHIIIIINIIICLIIITNIIIIIVVVDNVIIIIIIIIDIIISIIIGIFILIIITSSLQKNYHYKDNMFTLTQQQVPSIPTSSPLPLRFLHPRASARWCQFPYSNLVGKQAKLPT